VQRNLQCARLIDVPLVRTRQADGGEIERKAASDESCELLNRLPAVSGQQDISAEIEEARQLVLALDGFQCLGADGCGQIAGDKADGEKDEEGDPVLRIRQIERPHGREKKEVERQ